MTYLTEYDKIFFLSFMFGGALMIAHQTGLGINIGQHLVGAIYFYASVFVAVLMITFIRYLRECVKNA